MVSWDKIKLTNANAEFGMKVASTDDLPAHALPPYSDARYGLAFRFQWCINVEIQDTAAANRNYFQFTRVKAVQNLGRTFHILCCETSTEQFSFLLRFSCTSSVMDPRTDISLIGRQTNPAKTR